MRIIHNTMCPVQFSGELTDIKAIYNIIKAITFKEFAVMRPMEEGLKITVEDMKCVETSAYIPSNAFESYFIDSNEDITFKISLKILNECLNIYGDEGSPSLKMSYKGHGFPLYLVIKHSEENITVDCEIKTLTVDNFTEITLADECNVNNVVFNGDQFADLLSDLDLTSDVCEIKLSPNSPYFQIKASSMMGYSVIDISKDSDKVAIFKCNTETISKYAFLYIKQIFKAMHLASKISISTGESGLLGIQLIINSEQRQFYIEYYVTALCDD